MNEQDPVWTAVQYPNAGDFLGPAEKEYLQDNASPVSSEESFRQANPANPSHEELETISNKEWSAANESDPSLETVAGPKGNVKTVETQADQSEQSSQEQPELNARDRELIALAQSNSPRAGDAFGVLFYSKQNHIGSFLKYMGLDHEAIEDVLQITAIKALQAFAGFRVEKAELTSWLITIAKRSVIDIARMRISRPVEDLYGDTTVDQFFTRMPAPDNIERQIVASTILADALRKYRTIIKHPERIPSYCQVIIGELTLRQCADLFDIPVGTVKSGIHNMRRVMIDIIGDMP